MENAPLLPSTLISALRSDQYDPQHKPPIKQTENEITLTIQGQRTVQEIVEKATELFRKLQNTRLSEDISSRQSQHQSRELREHMKLLKGLLGRLRNVYDETKRTIPVPPGENLEKFIPFARDEDETSMETQVTGENAALENERAELQKKLKGKNEQLKEVIDRLRTAIWDINTMLALKPV